MKRSEITEAAFRNFKVPYRYKMGGTQTVILPNGKSKHFDDREYYSGRGAKYNSGIKHDAIGEVKVSRKQYIEFLKLLKEREANRKAWAIEAEATSARIEEAKTKGIYTIKDAKHGGGKYIELSNIESDGKYFDAERLAATLDISVEDAQLLRSRGKTYVFAKQLNTGKTIELYHPALSCNPLSIWFDYVSEDKVKEFNSQREDWVNAPYSHLVGQTSAANHFVC